MGHRARIEHTQMLGIDLGSQHSSMADLMYMEAMDCIESLYSEPPVTEIHSLPSAVTFRRHNRVFTAASESSDYGNMAWDFKRLHGQTLSVIQAEEKSGLKQRQACGPAVVETSSPLPDSVGLQVTHAGGVVAFSVEQLTAMLLRRLTGGNESDCVIAVPGHLSDAARHSVMTAANMVEGLNCLALVNETTAVAAEYAWTTRFGLTGKWKHNVVVVDLGHSGYQVAAYAIEEQGGVLRILASACDLEVSGKAFDKVLVSHFCQKLRDKYQVNVRDNPQDLARLTLDCEKLKCQMSSTSSDLLLDVKSLSDFSYIKLGSDVSVNQERFEEMCASLLDKVDSLLCMVMEQAGLNAVDDVHAVQLVGGGTRMPAVKKRIGKVLGMDKLNASNDGTIVARGCAILCSLLEPAIPTWRKLDVYDLNTPYPVVAGAASPSVKSRSVPMKGTPLDKQLMERFVEDEEKMTAKDKLVECIDEIRNAVNGPLQAFVGPGEQTLLLQALVDAEKWMEEGRENKEDRGGGRLRIRLKTADARIRHEMYKLKVLLKPIEKRQMISRLLDGVHWVIEDYTARINGLGKTDVEERLNQAKEWLQEKRLQSLQDLTQEPGINDDDIYEYQGALVGYLSDQVRPGPESAKNKVSEYIREMMLEVRDSGPLKRFAVEEERATLLKDLEDAMAWLDQEEDRQVEVYEDKRDQLETLIRHFRESCDEVKNRLEWTGFARLCMDVRNQAKYVKACREKYDSQDAVKVLNQREQDLYETRMWLEDQMDVLNQREQDLYETRMWLEDQMDVIMKQDLMQEHNIPEFEAHSRKVYDSSYSLWHLFHVPSPPADSPDLELRWSDLEPIDYYYITC